MKSQLDENKTLAELRDEMTELLAWQPVGSKKEWELSPFEFVCMTGTLEAFFGFAALLSPSLTEHDGRLFIEEGFDAAVYSSWCERGLSGHEVQRVMNHLHVRSFIQSQEISDFAALKVAERLAEIWRVTLGYRGVTVEVVGESYDELAVTFYSRTTIGTTERLDLTQVDDPEAPPKASR